MKASASNFWLACHLVQDITQIIKGVSVYYLIPVRQFLANGREYRAATDR